MGGLCYTRIKTAINGMAALNITQESEIQAYNFSIEHHV